MQEREDSELDQMEEKTAIEVTTETEVSEEPAKKKKKDRQPSRKQLQQLLVRRLSAPKDVSFSLLLV